MIEIEILAKALNQIANLTADDFDMSTTFWHKKEYKKGEYFNQQKNICRHLGFINTGVFRSYIIDKKTAAEKNMFLFSEKQI